MFHSLKEVKGVGDKLYKRLLEHFGSEKAALKALEDQEFQELLLAVPFQKAVELAREAYSRRHSFEYVELLKTPEAREIYASILAALREYACTDYARLKLALYYPTKDRAELERRRREVEKGVLLFSRLSGKKLEELKGVLRELKPLAAPRGKRVSGSVLAAGDEKLLADLERYQDLIEVFHLESQEDLEYLRNYELVRLVVPPNAALPPGAETLPRTIFLYSAEEEEIIPEAVLSFFLENRETIEACRRGLEILGEPEAGELAGIAEKLGELSRDPGSFAYASRNLSSTAEECAEEANKEVVRQVEERGVSLAGRDVLRVLSRLEKGDVYASLPQELTSIIAGVARKWEEECARRLGVESETIAFTGLFSGRLYPLEVNPEVLSRLEAFFTEEAVKAEFRRKQEAAAYLKGKEEAVKRALRGLLEADFLLALGEFATRFRARAAEINQSLGFSFAKGRHLLLMQRELLGELAVQPVSYVLGDGSSFREPRVSILTGANSGGKTTLLELIAQVQIMAQCGLPVLAEDARVPLLDGVYFYGRRRGDTSAGAFEALLRSLASIPGRPRKLVLADELEAITEPGAAARILEALLEFFHGMQTCLAVVVTHLGGELRGVSGKIRVDGIEASGLDENLNLVVDRNPVLNKLARSTPELILERLSKTDREHAGFYGTVLKKFK